MSNRYVLDAWSLVALLKAEEPAAAYVKKLLQRAVVEELLLALSLIHLGEVFYIISRWSGKDAANAALQTIYEAPIEILPVEEEAVFAAADYKSMNRMSYADAFALAAAVKLDAILVTGDPELISLSHIVRIEALQRRA